MHANRLITIQVCAMWLHAYYIDFKSDPVIDHMPLITGVLVLGSCEHEVECCNWPTYIP